MPTQSPTLPIIKKPLKWAGGKRWLVPRLREFWEPYQDCRLVEPFVGGMSITLGLLPKQALLNDANKHLINFYQQVQAGLTIDIPMENNREFYLKQRKRFNDLISVKLDNCIESAQLFYYLNQTNFQGLCRLNNSGLFNVPFGKYHHINYAKDFLYLKNILTNWEITNSEYNKIQTTANDIIYVDPPYDTVFTKYTDKNFKWQDQLDLVAWLDAQMGKVIASNQATNSIVNLYKSHGFTVSIINIPKMISCNNSRTPPQEILAWKGF